MCNDYVIIMLLSIAVMFDALLVLLTQPSTLLAIVTEALQRSQRNADTLRGTARTRAKRWTRWGTLYKGRPRSSRTPCTIKWRGSTQVGEKQLSKCLRYHTGVWREGWWNMVYTKGRSSKPPLFHCAAVEKKIGKAAR